MSRLVAVEQHYSTGLTRPNIERALIDAGKDPAALEPADLAMLEDFHTLGRFATAALADLAGVGPEDRVLDAGAGIGGAARFLAGQIGCRVTAVDVTAEYCEAATWLNECVRLDGMIDVRQADVLDLPFEDASFDVVVSQHVQMNIADKGGLYREARRVLAAGGRLALWDMVAGPEQPIRLPVPWAVEPELSHLVTAHELRSITADAGFDVRAWNDLTEPALPAMDALLAAPPSPLGLQVFVPDLPAKAANLTENLREDRTRLVQAVLVAR
ncbi:MAG TPA: methyltransferase domain-containing protein, partial [Conexibacter sp.]|jgi:sarcosine/dimethylglycine N-methyltransferase|nr:methyltransferase domain-containing protein [Conexibacter sp.]